MTAGLVEDIHISKIRHGKGIRNESEVEDFRELTLSIEHVGLLNPILVRMVEGYFEIVAGNRRFQACKTLGWKKIACQIVELDNKQAFEISLIENIHRKTLSPLEEGGSFQGLYLRLWLGRSF